MKNKERKGKERKEEKNQSKSGARCFPLLRTKECGGTGLAVFAVWPFFYNRLAKSFIKLTTCCFVFFVKNLLEPSGQKKKKKPLV